MADPSVSESDFPPHPTSEALSGPLDIDSKSPEMWNKATHKAGALSTVSEGKVTRGLFKAAPLQILLRIGCRMLPESVPMKEALCQGALLPSGARRRVSRTDKKDQ